MLTQLKRLTLAADGRYATTQELGFLKNYLASVESRLQTYEKVRNGQEQINQVFEAQIMAQNPDFFARGAKDMTEVCRRDRNHALRCLAIAMLLDDLERLRDDYLVWDQKLVKAFQEGHQVKLTYQVLAQVLDNYLNPEEYQLMQSFLQATEAALAP